MRVNWFSPLRPAQTGIAEYTSQVLPELRRQAEVVLWTDQKHWERGLESLAEVRHYDPAGLPLDEIEAADLNVYHMGNSPFHGALWEVSRQLPGLMVLHDLYLAHFFRNGRWKDLRCPVEFAAAMGHCYGDQGKAVADQLRTGQMPEWASRLFPMTEAAIGDSLGVIVHTRKGLRSLGGRGTPVTHLPLPYPASVRPTRRATRPGGEGGPTQLIVFGHLSLNRCLDKVMEALASFPWRERFQLSVYGTVAQRERLEELIDRLGIAPLVRFHGPVSDAVLDAALDWSDVAINLRYPSMGEASHSQLRLWDHALPSIVTKVGWYAELPADTVAHVRPGHEVEDLQNHLLAFLRDPGPFQRMGARGRERLERHHSAGQYVRELLRFGTQVARRTSLPAAPRVADSVAEAVGGWANDAMREWLRQEAGQAFAEMVSRRACPGGPGSEDKPRRSAERKVHG